MPATQLRGLLRTVFSVAGPPTDAETDGNLLGPFAETADPAAFVELVRRHGPWILGLCRRLAADSHDAEDAFQATFLVLARRAGAVRRRASAASWLHGVARRISVRGRARTFRFRSSVPAALPRALPDPAAVAAAREEALILHEEIARLPAQYREPILLCDLAGLDRAEAARRLETSEGSVKGRLERGRAALRDRLKSRGVATLAAAAVVTGDVVAVPSPLQESLIRAAIGSGTAAPSVVRLADAVIGMTAIRRMTAVAATMLGAVVVGLVAGPIGGRALEPIPPIPAAKALPTVPGAPIPPPDNRAAKAALNEAEKALEVVNGADMERVRLWCVVAEVYARLGDRDAANAALQKALAAPANANELTDVACAYAVLGDTKQVLALADEMRMAPARGPIDSLSGRDALILHAARKAATTGQTATALALADASESKNQQQWLAELARREAILVHYKAGDAVGAGKSVGELPSDEEKARALVGTVFLNAVYADLLDGEPGLAWLQIEAGDPAAARRSVRAAQDIVDATARAGADKQIGANARVAVVRALARLGDIESARGEFAKVKNGPFRIKGLVYLSMAHARAGNGKAALALVEEAESDEHRVYLLHQIAYAQAVTGDKGGAATSFRRAIELAERAGAGVHASNIVSAMAAAGDVAEAIRVAQRLNAGNMAGNIAYYQIKSGDYASAIDTAKGHETGRWWQAMILMEVAKAQARAGREADARAWIAKEEPLNRAYALTGLASGIIREDDRVKPAGQKQ